MKIIDLLNKIANGEEAPKKIKYDNNIYEYIRMWEQYVDEVTEKPLLKEISAYNYSGLNNEVEIIEEEKKMPEKIEYIVTDENGEFSINGFTFDYEQKMQIIDTLNQVIDYLKSKGE